MPRANDYQVGGQHYRVSETQPWDYIVARVGACFLAGSAMKYIIRYQRKGGLSDLAKARHYVLKLIETLQRGPITKPPEWESLWVHNGFSALEVNLAERAQSAAEKIAAAVTNHAESESTENVAESIDALNSALADVAALELAEQKIHVLASDME